MTTQVGLAATMARVAIPEVVPTLRAVRASPALD